MAQAMPMQNPVMQILRLAQRTRSLRMTMFLGGFNRSAEALRHHPKATFYGMAKAMPFPKSLLPTPSRFPSPNSSGQALRTFSPRCGSEWLGMTRWLVLSAPTPTSPAQDPSLRLKNGCVRDDSR